MIRGTTPTHYFTLPFGREMIESIEIGYGQKGRVVLVKRTDDCTFNGNEVSVKLTEQESMSFTRGGAVEVQIRVRTPEGDVIASDVITVSCDRCLFDEVME